MELRQGIVPSLTLAPFRAYAPLPMTAVHVSRKRMTAKKTTPQRGGRWSVL